MKTSKNLFVLIAITVLAFSVSAQADVSRKKAIKIGKKNFQKLIDESYHYKVEYDDIIALPVHSKTIWKNDFYLLYFLKDNQFQVEMEVDKKTGEPTILAIGIMSPPYHEQLDGTFSDKYFNADSVMNIGFRRFRMEQESVRLVYFGVIPRLGKRGVIWELFSGEGRKYISMTGATIKIDQLICDLNTNQRREGNFAADSIRLEDLVAEITRLNSLTETEQNRIKLTPERLDSLTGAHKQEIETIYKKFPKLRGKVKIKEKK